MKTPAVGIVILNWNGWRDTIECLESVYALDYPAFNVVLVDNHSSDDSMNQIEAWAQSERGRALIEGGLTRCNAGTPAETGFRHKSLHLIDAPDNGGFAKGNNHGIRYSMQQNAGLVWLLNNDTVAAPDALTALVRETQRSPDIGMCGSVLVYYHNRSQVQAYGGVYFNFKLAMGRQLGQGAPVGDVRLGEIKDSDLTYISGASLMLTRAFLDEVGLMEESYFLYYEEVDWAVRGRDWKLAIARDSVIYHKEGGSIGTKSLSARSPLSQYYLYRNIIRFYWLRKRWFFPVAVARVLREMSNTVKSRDWNLFRATRRAMVDGLMGRKGAGF
ncbi:glycosyltransferase family 2 protein [Amantichitinum ursilacus]|uniref:N-glycosyltransferase n=1 Tax=Amantichitinum ursilacus TaxID=857265 RepID=A0A0N0GML4_9NEIS|nr:glycosyltransferase family 2 protein [Amantichitinum ursilacus]KPC51826.1 N-glycosyltransferase [Amantichitinum ursilacus]